MREFGGVVEEFAREVWDEAHPCFKSMGAAYIPSRDKWGPQSTITIFTRDQTFVFECPEVNCTAFHFLSFVATIDPLTARP